MMKTMKISFLLVMLLFGLQALFIKRKYLFRKLLFQAIIYHDEEEYQQAKKLILFWTHLDWFGDYTKLHDQGCPSTDCEFTTNRSRLHEADAVVFRSSEFPSARNYYHNQSQVWVWLDIEAPTEPCSVNNLKKLKKHDLSKKVNWTMTYHRNADISQGYGCFLLKTQKVRPLRPQLMSSYPETMEAYLKARANGTTLEEVMGSEWKSFIERPQLVSWMSGHCKTNSKREEYIAELQKFAEVGTFGECGAHKCWNRDWKAYICWEKVMRPNYLFNMAMENNLCLDYVTEKVYQPLRHGLVPIVYGGANYSDYLPPGSFINARKYHPRDLAKLLIELKNDPVKYGRYHVWRKFWNIAYPSTMCEICDKLHRNITPKNYQDIDKFRKDNGQCLTPPSGIFKSEKWKDYIGKD